jgi:uncharacterized membrane protein YgdD (TMEM256/DUF423 family)
MNGITWIRFGAAFGFLGVAMGAFGAHGFKDRLASLGTAANFETAAQYQMYHALALLAVGLVGVYSKGSTALSVAGWSFSLGILVFSGSLYLLSLSGLKWLGAITPIGGVALLVGWAALAVAASRSPSATYLDLK